MSIFDVKTFGAIGDGKPGSNDWDAFQRALAAMEALSPPNAKKGSRGAILYIPFGEYFLRDTLYINRQMIIQGVSGAGPAAGSRLLFPPDTDGIVIEREGGAWGEWTEIRDVAIQSDGLYALSHHPKPSVNEDEPISASRGHIDHDPLHGHGVVLKSRARLVNCLIYGFHYDGVYIDTVDDSKNANSFEIHNCLIELNGRHGIYAAGTNSNAGRVIGVDCSSNAGWGIYNRSQHSNTYVGCHSAYNGHYATDVRCLLIDPNLPTLIYAGNADSGFYRATDGGIKWAAFNKGLSVGGFNAQISALAYATPNSLTSRNQSGGTLYMGTLDGGVWWLDLRAGLDLHNWRQINNGLSNQTVHALVMASDLSTLYAGTDRGLFVFEVESEAWTVVGLEDQTVQALAAVPGEPDSLIAGTAASGVFTSTGGAWSQLVKGLRDMNVTALAIDPESAATVFAGTPSGVFKLIKKEPWAEVLPSQHATALAIDPKNIYVGTKAGVFISSNRGASWIGPLKTGLKTLDIQALAIDPTNPKIMYVGTKGGYNASGNMGGVYRSIDGGQTWHGGPPDPFPAPPDPESAANTFYGGGYKTTGSSAAQTVLVGCYSESGQGSGNELGYPTLALGGTMGGGFNPISTAGIINENGILNLPLRSTVIHKVKTVVGTQLYNILPEDDVILIDLKAGRMNLVLNTAGSVAGQQFIIKRIDPPNTPDNSREAQIYSVLNEPIDTGKTIFLNKPNTGVILISTGSGYQIISTLGAIKLV